MRRMMFFGLSLIMGGLTEAAVRHSGQYLECSRGDCQMLGDSEVDFCHLINQHILYIGQLRLYIEGGPKYFEHCRYVN